MAESGLRLAGRRTLITGAAGGLGSAVAKSFVAEGARLLLTDRHEADLRRTSEALEDGSDGGSVASIACDLSKPEGVATLFERVDRQLGGLDILVACAGVGADPLMELAEPEWRYVIESNLMSYVACTQHAIERMRASGARDGIVILVGSISVHIKAVGESVYNAAKGGVAAFAETLRKELIPEGIRVTLIEPGAIATGMQPCSPEEREHQIAEHRMLPAAEVAEAILFAATRAPGVDVITLRIEPLIQKLH